MAEPEAPPVPALPKPKARKESSFAGIAQTIRDALETPCQTGQVLVIIPHLLLAILSPAAPQAPAAAGSTMTSPDAGTGKAPKALANLASYIRDEDYPAEAIRRGEQGTVRFRLLVTPAGGVGRCDVVGTSGYALLDETTCRVMAERAHFTPARNSSGAAVADQVEARIRWVLPKAFEPPPVRALSLVDLENIVRPTDYSAEARREPVEGVVHIAIVVATDGKVEQCAVLQTSGSSRLDEQTCLIVRQRARFTPARDASGTATYDIIQSVIDWRLNRK
jgi:protein TonB